MARNDFIAYKVNLYPVPVNSKYLRCRGTATVAYGHGYINTQSAPEIITQRILGTRWSRKKLVKTVAKG